jgi:epoxyqueuosine reductase
MNRDRIEKEIFSKLESKGYKARIISATHIEDLRNDIEKHHIKGLFDSNFYKEYKDYFKVKLKLDLSKINSIFIVAIPQPAFQLNFHWAQEIISVLIPPHYLYGRKIIEEINVLLANILNPEGYSVTYAKLPFKLLAVHSSLAEYGRNNIIYVPEMGSYLRLTAYISNFPIQNDIWEDLKRMDLCEKCSACILKCPTGAISTDRFLLHGERCITFHNEHPWQIPFPEWLDPSWHNCLVGCLYCQNVCPANKRVSKWIEKGPEFDEEETRLFLEGKSLDQIPQNTLKKLEKFELTEYFELFPRNLKVLLKNR